MIAFEVKLNGKRLCIAGAEDLSVLSANVTAVGKLGQKTVPARAGKPDLFYSIGGLTRGSDPSNNFHVLWKSISKLRLGDVVEIKVLETTKADRPKSRHKDKRKPKLKIS